MDRWASRLISKGTDPYGLGRWCYMVLCGEGPKQIALITAYRVSNSSISSLGDTTAATQKHRTLLHDAALWDTSKYNQPHLQLLLYLQAWISHLQEEGMSIILHIDNNEDILTHSGDFHPLPF